MARIHVVVACATGARTEVPCTEAEDAAAAAAETAYLASRAAQDAAEAALRDAVAAHPDPLVKALAARLGLG